MSHAETLLGNWGIEIGKARQLQFQHNEKLIQLVLPREPIPILYFSERITEWLPKGTQRFIWFADWDTDPHSQMYLIEKIRSFYGDTRPLIESPGILFDETSKDENEAFTSIAFLIMAFGWSGYLIAKDHSEYAYIFEGLAKFSCSTKEGANELLTLAKQYKLKIM